jgi:hypothetical protein
MIARNVGWVSLLYRITGSTFMRCIPRSITRARPAGRSSVPPPCWSGTWWHTLEGSPSAVGSATRPTRWLQGPLGAFPLPLPHSAFGFPRSMFVTFRLSQLISRMWQFDSVSWRMWCGCSSLEEHVLSMYEALGPFPSTVKKRGKKIYIYIYIHTHTHTLYIYIKYGQSL